jgi:hypothetical protein
MAYGLVALFLKETPKYPDFPPEFATQVGWMIFAAIALVCFYAWTRAHSVRRALLALEDPRTMAILRIGFGLFTIFCFLNLFPYWRMLWSDEGVFDMAYAQDRLGRGALRAWTPEDGFFGLHSGEVFFPYIFGVDIDLSFAERFEQWRLWSIGVFLWNKPSLHYFYGSPSFVVSYMIVFFTVLLLYTAGVFTRVMGVVAWLMMSGVYNRNALYWEGTDTVYRTFWFILLWGKTGHAWSFDNWLRCRRLRAQGRLDEAETPKGGPSDSVVYYGIAAMFLALGLGTVVLEIPVIWTGGFAAAGSFVVLGLRARGKKPVAPESVDAALKEPIYRRVPAWPRYLFMLQLSVIYITTGAVKTGSVWAEGDALYYALNMDHFYRFEYFTQWVSSVFGLNLFRVNSWVTHYWERLFPLVLLGVGLKFNLENRDEPWFKKQNVLWRRVLSWAAMLGAYLLIYRIVLITTPFCTPLVKDQVQDTSHKIFMIHLFFAGILPLWALGWIALGRWPLTLFRGGKSLGKLTKKFAWLKLPELRITQETIRWIFFGRRIWLTIGFIFHGTLILFMNIGMFAPIMLMAYAGFVRGDEWAKVFRWVRKHARGPLRRKEPGVDWWLQDAQDPATVKVRGRSVPDVVVLAFGLAGAWLIYKQVEKVEWVETATYWWLAAIVAVSVAFRFWPPKPSTLTGSRNPPLAYTALGRSLALFAVVWHASAVGLHLFPSYPIFNKWRSPARKVHSSWLRGVGATQGWRMFAPNPPRSNTFMKTVVVLDNGDRWDLRNNAYHYGERGSTSSRPSPWIFNDRMRKMQRRMVGKGKWYLRYWADFHCREWFLEHGEMPKEIDVRKYVNRIPGPKVTSFWVPKKFKGRKDRSSGATVGVPYDPRKLKTREHAVQTHKCKEKELPLRMKERYGYEVTGEDEAKAERDAQQRKRKFSSRKAAWDRRKDWGRWFAEDDKAKKKAAAKAKARTSAGAASYFNRMKNDDPPEDDQQAAGDDGGVEEDED